MVEHLGVYDVVEHLAEHVGVPVMRWWNSSASMTWWNTSVEHLGVPVTRWRNISASVHTVHIHGP